MPVLLYACEKISISSAKAESNADLLSQLAYRSGGAICNTVSSLASRVSFVRPNVTCHLSHCVTVTSCHNVTAAIKKFCSSTDYCSSMLYQQSLNLPFYHDRRALRTNGSRRHKHVTVLGICKVITDGEPSLATSSD
jgi:hypothetical protein